MLRCLPATIAASLLLLATTVGVAAEAVRVSTTSGRRFDGEISSRTTVEKLWLVQRTGFAEIARPIAWDNIVAADFRGQSLTSHQLRSALVDDAMPTASAKPVAAALVQDEPGDLRQDPFGDDLPADALPNVDEIDEELPAPRAAQVSVSQPLSHAEFLALTTPPVASVRFDAHIANWDADVEADGLVVQVVPVDRHGQVVPLRGALQVELFGVKYIAFQDAAHKRGRSFQRLGFWTQQLVPDYIQSDGGWFKLPFQAAQPEFDPRIGYSGLVNVKLVVPGAGVYEASLDSVRLRPFAPLRDALQRDTGHRFFPTELTGRGKRSW